MRNTIQFYVVLLHKSQNASMKHNFFKNCNLIKDTWTSYNKVNISIILDIECSLFQFIHTHLWVKGKGFWKSEGTWIILVIFSKFLTLDKFLKVFKFSVWHFKYYHDIFKNIYFYFHYITKQLNFTEVAWGACFIQYQMFKTHRF